MPSTKMFYSEQDIPVLFNLPIFLSVFETRKHLARNVYYKKTLLCSVRHVSETNGKQSVDLKENLKVKVG
jgi:hypothetical protein